MKIIFLGTNGWYSTETGNTACVLVDASEYYIIFDAGDGIHKLDEYITSNKPIYLFLSHFHLEHIVGLHILNKFKFEQDINIYGQEGTRRFLNSLIKRPFSAPFKDLAVKVKITELSEGIHKVPFPVVSKFLLHADPCFGYRVSLDNKTITYCTDTGICSNSLELSRNAHVLIHECALKSGQLNNSWPHTNAQQAAELAKEANVGQLILSHFSAAIYGTIADRIQVEGEARKIFHNTVAAIDRMEINI